MLENKVVLFIGTVWPEPDSSAAGVRMMQLIEFFRDHGSEVVFGTSASESAYSVDLRSMGIRCTNVQINDSGFDDLATHINPDIVIFDRFMTEEQFGWRITDQCPDAVQILDSEDLHFLRVGRRKRAEHFAEEETVSDYLKSDIAMRELSSIYRCDLSLIISKAEMEILKRINIPPEILHYHPIVSERADKTSVSSYSSRKGFFTIGNFRHPPNRDSVHFIRKEVWPLIRSAMPDAEMHVYGSYASENDLQLNNPDNGFYVHGRAENLEAVLSKHRVLLAPLRFGAGLKGKFLSAFTAGIPAVTTSLGSEGIISDHSVWPGSVCDTREEIAKHAAALYSDESEWNSASEKCINLLNDHFAGENHFSDLKKKINYLQGHLSQHRLNNLTGQMLQFNSNRATKFMSRWIEEKNKNKT